MPAAQTTCHTVPLPPAGTLAAARFVVSGVLGLVHAALRQVMPMIPRTGPRRR